MIQEFDKFQILVWFKNLVINFLHKCGCVDFGIDMVIFFHHVDVANFIIYVCFFSIYRTHVSSSFNIASS